MYTLTPTTASNIPFFPLTYLIIHAYAIPFVSCVYIHLEQEKEKK